MTYLIISDFHLNHKVSTKELKFYKQLFLSVDKIIINGDFWEGMRPIANIDKFIKSQWNELLQILKDKSAIYIFGNHDFYEIDEQEKALWLTEAQKVFSSISHEYTINLGNKVYKIIHGSQFRHPFMINSALFEYLYYKVSKLVSKTFLGSRIYNFIGGKWNRRIIETVIPTLQSNEILICGDTHAPMKSDRYINTGFNFSGNYGYLILTDNFEKLYFGRM